MNNLFERIMEKTKLAKETLAKIEMTGESGAGMVQVVMDGHYQVRRMVVDDEVYKEGKAVVLDLLASATNEATAKVREAVREKMTQLVGNVGLPSDFSSLF